MFFFNKIIVNRILVQPPACQRLKNGVCCGFDEVPPRQLAKTGHQSSNSPPSGLFAWLIWRLFALWNHLSQPKTLFHRADAEVAQRGSYTQNRRMLLRAIPFSLRLSGRQRLRQAPIGNSSACEP